jgi:hypothetical protein
MSSLFSGLFQVAQYGNLLEINKSEGSASRSCYFEKKRKHGISVEENTTILI